MVNWLISEVIKVEAFIQSGPGTAGTFNTGAVKIDQGRRFAFLVNVGTPGASGTIDAEIDWSATSGGTYAKIGTTSITQDTTGAAVHLLEVSTEQVRNLQPTAMYLKGKIVTGTAATPIGGIMLSVSDRFNPITQGSVVGQVIKANA